MPVENQTVEKTSNTRRTSSAQRFFIGINTFVYWLSGGKIGGRFGKSLVLLLTTAGRRTGQQRTIPLFYLKDGDILILVASNGGAPAHPVWWLNLQANLEALVEIGKKKLLVEARQADEEERERLWPLLVSMYSGYAGYQKKTAREIPVVILKPHDATE